MKRKLYFFLTLVLLLSIYTNVAFAYSVPFDGYTASVGTWFNTTKVLGVTVQVSATGYTTYSTSDCGVSVTTTCKYHDTLFDVYFYRTATGSSGSGGQCSAVTERVDGLRYHAESADSEHHVVHNGNHLYLESHAN